MSAGWAKTEDSMQTTQMDIAVAIALRGLKKEVV